MANNYYVYAIVRPGTVVPRDLLGIGDRTISLVPYKDLAAAVSELGSVKAQPTGEHVLRHEEIVEVLSQASPALPLRFGTVLPRIAAVQAAIAERYAVLLSDLERLGGRVELGLTVLWDEQELTGEEREETLAPVAGISGTDYLRSRVATYRRKEAARARAERLMQEMDNRLDAHAIDHRGTVLPTPRLTVRAAYLVEPSNVPAFRQSFDTIRAEHPDLRFLMSGPWPPYTFVTPVSGGEPLANLLSIVQQRGRT